MAAQLPSLDSGGWVVFPTADDLVASWATYVSKGAIMVRPTGPLTPLEQLDIQVMAPGLTSPVRLRVEVVQLQADRAMLRLLEAAPPLPALSVMLHLLEAAPELPAATPPRGPPPRTITPASPWKVVASFEAAAVVEEPPTPAEAPAEPAPAPEPVPEPPPVTAVTMISHMPPYFTGDALRFNSIEDLNAARDDIAALGAVIAIVDGKIPQGSVELRLAVGSRETKGRTKATLMASSPGTCVVQAENRSAFRALLEELDTASTAMPRAPGPDAGPAPAARTFSFPKAGPIENPTTPQGILALPMSRTPTEQELARPSVPLLLRWLRTARGTQRVEMSALDHPVFTVVIVDGREVRSPASLNTLGRSLSLPRMSYQLSELGRPPQMTTTARTLHLIAEVLRGLCAQCTVEELAAGFPKKGDLCARAIPDVVGGLALPPHHQRFVKNDVNGTQFVEEITRAAVGARTVWETLYILELFNGISWDEPAAGKKPSARIANDASERTAPVFVGDASAFEGKDHFQVLGLHWSSSPNEILEAYHRLRADYAPGGSKRSEVSAIAEKNAKRVDEAYKILGNTLLRQGYRRGQYNLVWSHQAQLLIQKAKLSVYRKDVREAIEILTAAEDIWSSEEGRKLLGGLLKKIDDQKP